MAEETWMDKEEAMKKGFADEVLENKKVAACAGLHKWFARYKHPPFFEKKKQAEVQEGNPEPVADRDQPDQKDLANPKKQFWATKKIY